MDRLVVVVQVVVVEVVVVQVAAQVPQDDHRV
jgi:hypothetical protein